MKFGLPFRFSAVVGVVAVSAGVLLRASPPLTAAELPPAGDKKVDFHTDLLPILARCIRCHTGDEPQGNFRLEDRATLLKGGDSGAAVVVGKSADSLLIKMVAGLEKDRLMPAQGTRLTNRQVGVLRAWIDQGMA